jgi:dolichol-phosphate mannosyltransferase
MQQPSGFAYKLPAIAVIIPCYKVKAHILDVVASIGEEVKSIYVVDDACLEFTGAHVEEHCKDARVNVILNQENKGVGGAVMAGYQQALADGADILVKIDGDGQMDPSLILDFVTPIIAGEADYTKGNRFYNPEELWSMPKIRMFGNAILSLVAKISTGYWQSFDPNNGYTAIHANAARSLPFHKISQRYFFETDMLFRLNILRAVVSDVPMAAKYADEKSNLVIRRNIGEFMRKHLRNAFKRIIYNYYLRDSSLASIELPLGIFLLLFGMIYGACKWISFAAQHIAAPAGTVILSVLPILLGVQFILAFFAYDISNLPTRPIHKNSSVRRRS